MPAKFLEDLSGPSIEQFLQTCDTAVLPLGSIETHGPHLSLLADPLVADGILRRAAERISGNVIILPLIHFAIVCQHGFNRNKAYPGSYGVREETLTHYLVDIAKSVARDGITKLLIYNGHGGNSAVVRTACVDIEKEIPGLYCFSWYVIEGMDIAGLFPEEGGCHGGAFETSLDMALAPDHVWMGTNPPANTTRRIPIENASGLGYFPDWVFTTRGHGYHGDPKGASVEKGEQMVEQAVAKFVPMIDELSRLDVSTLKAPEEPNAPFK